MRMLWLSLGLMVLFLSGVHMAPANEEEERLLGGVNATSKDFEQFNFYVRMGQMTTDNQSHTSLQTLCQGVLYDSETIITVAHCAMFTQYLTHAVCGTVETQTRNISSVTLHPYFNSSSIVFLVNDIAVVKLASSFTPSKYCQPAKLPSCSSNTYYNQNVTVFGFDTTDSSPPWFKRNWVTVTMTVVPGQTCYWKYLGSAYNSFLQECLIDVEKSQTACRNDHGTAAMTDDGTVIALGSWLLTPCLKGDTSVPAVYVRLSHYMDWIAYIANAWWVWA